jgi:hypothetical protein
MLTRGHPSLLMIVLLVITMMMLMVVVVRKAALAAISAQVVTMMFYRVRWEGVELLMEERAHNLLYLDLPLLYHCARGE